MERRQQITEAAAVLFSEQGYAAAGMRQLAGRLGIEAASLYSHVKGKEDLLQEICFGIAEDFFAAKERVVSCELRAAAQLEAAIEAHIAVVTENTKAATVFLHEWRHLSQPALAQYNQMRRAYEDWFASLVQAGIAQGTFAEVNVRFTAVALLASLNSVIQWYRPNGSLAPAQIASRMTKLFLDGLHAHSPATDGLKMPGQSLS